MDVDPSRGEVIWRLVEVTFAERVRDGIVDGVERLLTDDDDGRVDDDIKRECAVNECERGGGTGGGGLVFVEPWKAMVAGFKTVRDDDEEEGTTVERNGVMEILSWFLGEELFDTVMGNVAERARTFRVNPFDIDSFDGRILFANIEV